MTHVFTTHGAAGLGGELAIGHSVVVPSARTVCHGTEWGSLSSLCMYTKLPETLTYLASTVGASTVVISALLSSPSEPSLRTARSTIAGCHA